MSISLLFNEENIKEENLNQTINYIKGVYRALGYDIDRVDWMVRRLPEDVIILFTPYLKNGKPARKLVPYERRLLELEKWGNWYCLGGREERLGSIIPLAMEKANLSSEFLNETGLGMLMLSPEVSQDDYEHLIQIGEGLVSKKVVRYSPETNYDAIIAVELLVLKGGTIIPSSPSSSEEVFSGELNKGEIYCILPEDYTMDRLKEGVRLIKKGRLPEEHFSGRWNRLSPNAPLEDVYERSLINHVVGVLAYFQLSKDYPYLAPSIYDVYIGSFYEIVAPIATVEQKIQYNFYLHQLYREYEEGWKIIQYENHSDLIVKRFAYEKISELVFCPKTPMAADNWYAPKFLLVFKPEKILDEDDLQDEQEELEDLLRRQPELLGPNKEKRCFINCGLEKSLCCVDTRMKERLVPEDLVDFGEVLEITPQEEEKLLRMDFGLRGYFSLGGVLKGLFKNPPVPPPLSSYNIEGEGGKEGKVLTVKKEANMLLYMIKTKEGDIPILTRDQQEVLEKDYEDQLFLLWEEGHLLTPWGYAMLDKQYPTQNINPEQCSGGQCLLQF